MKKCIHCGATRFERRADEHVVEAAGHKFTTRVPAEVCTACNETYTDAGALERADLEAARALADAGEVSGASFRFMRTALGFTGRALAAELGATPETISRWEHGERDVDALAWATVAALVRDKLDGSTRTADQLRVIREPKKLAKAVCLPATTATSR